MMRSKYLFAMGLLTVMAPSWESRADVLGTFGPVTISVSHTPTPSLPGYSTWVLNASTSTRRLRVFDFRYPFVANYGFFGPMNQVHPFGIETPYNDLSSVPGLGMEADSHFLFNTLAVATGPGSVDTISELRAAGGDRGDLFGYNFDFVQVVIADGDQVDFSGTIGLDSSDSLIENFPISGRLGFVPEPGTMALTGIGSGILAVLGRRKARQFVRASTAHIDNSFHPGEEPMYRSSLVATLVILCVPTSVFAGSSISGTFVPTPGLPGYATFTLTATTNDGSGIVGFDFARLSTYGMFGPMNQVNPFGQVTIFQDANNAFPFFGADVAQDSQFLFPSSIALIPPGFSSESPTQLRSIFAFSSSRGTSVNFVQLVLPPLATVIGVGEVTIRRDTEFFDNPVSFQLYNPLPEPGAVGLAMLALAGGLGLVRRRPGVRLQSSLGSSLLRRRGMLRGALAVGIGVALSGAASAGVIITHWGVPTVGLPGFTTWTVTASTDNGDQIVGFDFASLPSYGISGPMNQVNPAGLPTIFSDNNFVFPSVGADVSQDSQFLFKRSDVTVPAGYASESTSSLRAVFASPVSLGTTVPFVQLVMEYEKAPSYFGAVTVKRSSRFYDVPVNVLCFTCFPPVITDAFLDNVAADVPGGVDHTLVVSYPTAPGSSLSDFRFDSFTPPAGGNGVGPATPATFDYATRQFHWDTVGSPLGTYKWLVTATNYSGIDYGSITVRITAVPEPAMLSLATVALVAQCAFGRRRRPS